jgi:heme exporter protein C
MLSRFANPTRFLKLANMLTPWCGWGAALCIAAGLYLAFFGSPPDYQQGEAVRIMYVHVPSAWMALFVYAFLAIAAAVGFVWRHPLAHVAAREAAPIGACFTVICLATGSLWGKPMWGAWWAWGDARLVSVLILFFFYLGYIALANAFDEPTRGERAAAILAIVGVVNLPIVKFSVEWWATLHQPASVVKLSGPSIHASMLAPLFLAAVGFMLLFAALLFVRMKTALNTRRVRALQIAQAAA